MSREEGHKSRIKGCDELDRAGGNAENRTMAEAIAAPSKSWPIGIF
jgi:hypothetical protein